MIATISRLFFVLVVSVFTHEAGHLLFFRLVLKRKVKLRWNPESYRFEVGVPGDYLGISNNEHAGLALSGIVAGFIPMFIFLSNPFHIAICIGLYMMGVETDMTIISNAIIKNAKEGE